MVKAALITAFVSSLGLKPALAETVGVDLPWPAQLGVTGMLGALLWYQTRSGADAVRALGDRHDSANAKLCTEIEGLRADQREANDKQLSLLRECLIEKRKQ